MFSFKLRKITCHCDRFALKQKQKIIYHKDLSMKAYMVVIPLFSFVLTACSTPATSLNNEDLCAKLAEGEYFKNNWIWDPAFKEYQDRKTKGTISVEQCETIKAKKIASFAKKDAEAEVEAD